MVFALKIWRHYLYDVHVDIFIGHKILQYVWLQLFKYYYMSISYHPCKVNEVVDALTRLSTGSTTYVEKEKSELAKDVQRLARLGVRLMDSTKEG